MTVMKTENFFLAYLSGLMLISCSAHGAEILSKDRSFYIVTKPSPGVVQVDLLLLNLSNEKRYFSVDFNKNIAKDCGGFRIAGNEEKEPPLEQGELAGIGSMAIRSILYKTAQSFSEDCALHMPVKFYGYNESDQKIENSINLESLPYSDGRFKNLLGSSSETLKISSGGYKFGGIYEKADGTSRDSYLTIFWINEGKFTKSLELSKLDVSCGNKKAVESSKLFSIKDSVERSLGYSYFSIKPRNLDISKCSVSVRFIHDGSPEKEISLNNFKLSRGTFFIFGRI